MSAPFKMRGWGGYTNSPIRQESFLRSLSEKVEGFVTGLKDSLTSIGDQIKTDFNIRPVSAETKRIRSEAKNIGVSEYQYRTNTGSTFARMNIQRSKIRHKQEVDKNKTVSLKVQTPTLTNITGDLGDIKISTIPTTSITQSSDISSDITSDKVESKFTKGDLSTMSYFSKERIAEYKGRNWAMDHTTDRSIIKSSGETDVVVSSDKKKKKKPNIPSSSSTAAFNQTFTGDVSGGGGRGGQPIYPIHEFY